MRGHKRSNYRSTRQLTTCLLGMLALTALFASAGVWSNFLELDLLMRFKAGSELSSRQAFGVEARQFVLGVAQAALFGITGLAWCVWVHRSSQNAHALDVNGDLHFTPGWAVAWQVIPLANLLKARQVMSELWMASEPDGAMRWQTSSRMIPAWWASLAASGILCFVGLRVGTRSSSLEEMMVSNWLAIGSGLMLMIAAAAAMTVIRDISNRHMAMNEQQIARRVVLDKSANERPTMITHHHAA